MRKKVGGRALSSILLTEPMADEQGPKEGEAVPGSRASKRVERPFQASAAELMARGTVTSELRAEMRRAMGICKSLGARIERLLDKLPRDEMPSPEWATLKDGYFLALTRVTDCQLKLEKEARLRLKGIPVDRLNEATRDLMKRQVADLIAESARGSKARRGKKVGA